ncbi:FtsW/RodA/SpoVE family cell cycle protein [Hydrogenobaculum acidophilum]
MRFYVKEWDEVILVSVLLLYIIGLVNISSASLVGIAFLKFNIALYKKLILQVVAGVLGFLIAGFLTKFDYEKLKNPKFIYSIITLNMLLLMVVLVIKYARHMPVNRWLFGTSLQVSEFSKIISIVFLAYYISRKGEVSGTRELGFASFIIAFQSLLIFLEPDRGSAIFLLFIGFVMLWIGNAPPKVLYPTLVAFAILGVLFLFLKTGGNYVEGRFVAWLNPFAKANTKGYQIIQSLFAFAHGKLFGVGIGEGIQKEGYLPEIDTDYALALIGEEWGFLGVLFVVFLYAGLVYRIFKISDFAEDTFGKLIAFGIGMYIAIESIWNMMMAMNLIPSKGIALPFISYGSSNLLANLIAIGLVMSVYRKEKKPWKRLS